MAEEIDPIRAYALSQAVEYMKGWPNASEGGAVRMAKAFEAYLRGEQP